MRTSTPFFAALFAVGTLAVSAASNSFAEENKIRQDAKEVGHAVGAAVREVGHETKKVAKKVGHATKKAVHETGEALHDGAKEFKKAVKGEGEKEK